MDDDAASKPTSTTTENNYGDLDQAIASLTALALKDGKVSEAIEGLLVKEKQFRLAADVPGTKRVVLAIIRAAHASGDWKLLNEQIVLLSKRRAQLKQAVTEMVREAINFVDGPPDLDTKIELIKTLLAVTSGKIYVEIERARLTRKLAKIKEDQGLISEAADIMQEVAVETFSAMAKTEKVAFILEQVRLCLDRKDYMRAQILARKISTRVFEEAAQEKKKKKSSMDEEAVMEEAAPDIPSMVELKLRYYELMIRYHIHDRDYLEICRCYQNIYQTPPVQDNPPKWMPVLKKICWFLCMAPHGTMQSSLLHSTYEDKKLQELPLYRQLLKHFITMEVVRWPILAEAYRSELESEPSIFGGEWGKKALEDLKQRIIEHNILVVSKYYSRITLKRLSEVLDLSLAEGEKYLADTVVAKTLTAKIDRPSGIVTFQAQQESHETLNSWSSNIERLLGLVERSCHQIHKETMVHKVTLPHV